MTHMSEQTKAAVDIMSLGTILATLAAWLPPLAALMSIVWTLIRIYETKTVQRLIEKYFGAKPLASEQNTDQ